MEQDVMRQNARPNILLALADDASHFSAYGHEFVRTPNFDRIAEEGLLFTRAFTTNPKCAPSRASILTGRHTWQNRECCLHWNYWPQDLPVYTDYLIEAGYHVGFTGKPWAPGNWERCGRRQNPAGREYNEHTLTPPAGSLICNCDYAANFRDFLADRADGHAFCFWCGVREPHRGYRFGEGRRNGKHFDEIKEIPPYWPQDDVVREDMLDYAFEVEWFDKQLGKAIEVLAEKGELHNTIVIVTSDNGAPFPRVKGQMYDDDFRLPFAVMWKGRLAGGRRIDDLVSFTDIAPTILESAGLPVPAGMAGKSLFDIFRAGGSGMVTPDRTRAYMGRERHDLGREGDLGYPVRCIRTPRYLCCRNFAPDRWPAGNPETNYTNCDGSPTKSRILELNDEGDHAFFQLSFGKRPAEELFDIDQDPYCLENLADESAYADLKEAFWRELEAKLKETGDPRIYGNGDVFESYEYAGSSRHSWEVRLHRSAMIQGAESS
jgi:arylsulfatase A-like enzyme